jgi:hypothetical protein
MLLFALPHGAFARTRPVAGPTTVAQHGHVDKTAAELAVSPLVNAKIRAFVRSRHDATRSAVLARVVVPLVLLLLVETELVAAGGRAEARLLRAFVVPLIALFVIMAVVRFRAYTA